MLLTLYGFNEYLRLLRIAPTNPQNLCHCCFNDYERSQQYCLLKEGMKNRLKLKTILPRFFFIIP